MSDKLIDLNGLSIFKNQLDSYYALTSELNELSAKLKSTKLLAEKSNFKSEANFRAFSYGFDYLCIEDFSEISDVDTTALDGATVISNMYRSQDQLIHKNTTGTLTIQSKTFELDSTPRDALVFLDYEGSGSINIYFSKNNGGDWTPLQNDKLTSINSLIQKKVKVKLELVGEVILKNIAWGCK